MKAHSIRDLWEARHLKVIRDTCTAEEAKAISLRLGGLNVSEPSPPELNAPTFRECVYEWQQPPGGFV